MVHPPQGTRLHVFTQDSIAVSSPLLVLPLLSFLICVTSISSDRPALCITFLQILKLATLHASSQEQPVSAGEHGCLGHEVEWGTKLNGNMKVKKVTQI